MVPASTGEGEPSNAETQVAIAIRLLAEITDEREWAASFDSTTDAQWDQLAEMARRAIADDPTTPLGEMFSLTRGA